MVAVFGELLSDRNWYFPRWLEWIPRIDVEGRIEEHAEDTPGGTINATAVPARAAGAAEPGV